MPAYNENSFIHPIITVQYFCWDPQMDYPTRSGRWEGKESSPEVWPGPAHLSLVGEASQETLPLTPVQDLQLFVVDAVLLPDVLSRVQRRPFLVHAKLSAATAALGDEI